MAHYLSNDDNTAKIKVLDEFGFGDAAENERHHVAVIDAFNKYKWREDDFLLVCYPKNGTHLTWEIMNMLLRGSAAYIKESKVYCMMDMTPVTRCDEWFPSPRVLNTHCRLDVLPKEFRGRKTVLAMRNAKDTMVSVYEHVTKMMKMLDANSEIGKQVSAMSFSTFLKLSQDKDQPFGTYFDFVEYMWSLRDDPTMLIVYYEDLVLDPVGSIQKLDEFMGTKRSPELVQQIADAMNIDKMRTGKAASMDEIAKDVGVFPTSKKESAAEIYRKGTIGDWKNYFTVADNEFFDSVLEKWSVGSEIPFIYST